MTAPAVANTDSTYVGGMTTMTSDPTFKSALALSATSIGQDMIKGRAPAFKEAAVLGIADYAAQKYVKGYIQGTLQSFSGESYWSGKLAEGASLAAVLYASSMVGLSSRGTEAEGIVNSPSLGNGQFARLLSSILDAGILVLERDVVLFGANKMGVIS